ncbi:LOW QUALITY PROTEIN: hypothetical protein U9M48_032504 [Paspalum notatum var. saurae]|uniref:Uncharacterized protein n=1 Tax=Paspalum notatum var. saurae TaxID=547442 RepID=A0AAQ3U7Z2_PASNO
MSNQWLRMVERPAAIVHATRSGSPCSAWISLDSAATASGSSNDGDELGAARLRRPAHRRQLLGALRHLPRELLAKDPLPLSSAAASSSSSEISSRLLRSRAARSTTCTSARSPAVAAGPPPPPPPEEDPLFFLRLHSSATQSCSADMGAADCAFFGGGAGSPMAGPGTAPWRPVPTPRRRGQTCGSMPWWTAPAAGACAGGGARCAAMALTWWRLADQVREEGEGAPEPTDLPLGRAWRGPCTRA